MQKFVKIPQIEFIFQRLFVFLFIKLKQSLFREETHSIDSVGHLGRQERHCLLEVVSFYRGG